MTTNSRLSAEAEFPWVTSNGNNLRIKYLIQIRLLYLRHFIDKIRRQYLKDIEKKRPCRFCLSYTPIIRSNQSNPFTKMAVWFQSNILMVVFTKLSTLSLSLGFSGGQDGGGWGGTPRQDAAYNSFGGRGKSSFYNDRGSSGGRG